MRFLQYLIEVKWIVFLELLPIIIALSYGSYNMNIVPMQWALQDATLSVVHRYNRAALAHRFGDAPDPIASLSDQLNRER